MSERTKIPVPFTLLYLLCGGLGRQHAKGAAGNRYRSIYEPTEPSQPMMSDNVNDEDRPQHWELCPLLSLGWEGSVKKRLGRSSTRLANTSIVPCNFLKLKNQAIFPFIIVF